MEKFVCLHTNTRTHVNDVSSSSWLTSTNRRYAVQCPPLHRHIRALLQLHVTAPRVTVDLLESFSYRCRAYRIFVDAYTHSHASDVLLVFVKRKQEKSGFRLLLWRNRNDITTFFPRVRRPFFKKTFKTFWRANTRVSAVSSSPSSFKGVFRGITFLLVPCVYAQLLPFSFLFWRVFCLRFFFWHGFLMKKAFFLSTFSSPLFYGQIPFEAVYKGTLGKREVCDAKR